MRTKLAESNQRKDRHRPRVASATNKFLHCIKVLECTETWCRTHSFDDSNPRVRPGRLVREGRYPTSTLYLYCMHGCRRQSWHSERSAAEPDWPAGRAGGPIVIIRYILYIHPTQLYRCH